MCYSVCLVCAALYAGRARGDALCATLLAEGIGRVGRAGDAGGDALRMLQVPEVMRCVLLDTLKGTEGGLCLAVLEGAGGAAADAPCAVDGSEVLEVIRCVLLCSLEVPDCDALCATLLGWRLWRVGSISGLRNFRRVSQLARYSPPSNGGHATRNIL